VDRNGAEQEESEVENTISPPGRIQVFDSSGQLETAVENPSVSELPVSLESHSAASAETNPEIPTEIGTNQEAET
jgi:hypothetical protein